MVIKASSAPLEVLLTIQAFDIDGEPITRLVHLNTDTMMGKQLLLVSGKTEFKPVQIGNYHFFAPSTATEKLLQEFLPEELYDRIVTTTSRGTK
jgi:hypothetical protein